MQRRQEVVTAVYFICILAHCHNSVEESHAPLRKLVICSLFVYVLGWLTRLRGVFLRVDNWLNHRPFSWGSGRVMEGEICLIDYLLLRKVPRENLSRLRTTLSWPASMFIRDFFSLWIVSVGHTPVYYGCRKKLAKLSFAVAIIKKPTQCMKITRTVS